ncbi:hypothetical protein BOSP111201_10040 [Bordetella sputigena]
MADPPIVPRPHEVIARLNKAANAVLMSRDAALQACVGLAAFNALLKTTLR